MVGSLLFVLAPINTVDAVTLHYNHNVCPLLFAFVVNLRKHNGFIVLNDSVVRSFRINCVHLKQRGS